MICHQIKHLKRYRFKIARHLPPRIVTFKDFALVFKDLFRLGIRPSIFPLHYISRGRVDLGNDAQKRTWALSLLHGSLGECPNKSTLFDSVDVSAQTWLRWP